MTLTGTQVSFQGLTLGDKASTGYSLEHLGDLLGFNQQAATLGFGVHHGGKAGPARIPDLQWTFRAHALGQKIPGDSGGGGDPDIATRVQARLAALMARFQPFLDPTTEAEFHWVLTGDITEYVRMARCLARKPSLTNDDLGTGDIPVDITMAASDPCYYSATVHTSTPISRGSTTTVHNGGDFGPLHGHLLHRASIAGPVTNPRIYLGDGSDGRGIYFHAPVADGETLVIDWSTKAITIGLNSAFPFATGTGGKTLPGFFPLPPGDTVVHFDADAGTGQMTFTNRDTFL